jgi:hypothetical protein
MFAREDNIFESDKQIILFVWYRKKMYLCDRIIFDDKIYVSFN